MVDEISKRLRHQKIIMNGMYKGNRIELQNSRTSKAFSLSLNVNN